MKKIKISTEHIRNTKRKDEKKLKKMKNNDKILEKKETFKQNRKTVIRAVR